MWMFRSSKSDKGPAEGTAPAPDASTGSASEMPDRSHEVTEIDENDYLENSEEFEFVTGKKQLQKLEDEIKDKADAIEDLKAQLNLQINKFQNADKLHKSELTYRDKLVSEADAKQSEYMRQMQPLKRDLEIKETSLKEKTKTIEELNAIVAKHKAEMDALQKALNEARGKTTELLQQNEQQNQTHRTSMEVKAKEINDLTARIVQLEAELDKLKRANRDQANLLEAMKAMKDQQKEGNQQLMDQTIQLKSAEQKAKDLEEENNKLRDDVARLKQAQLKDKTDREKSMNDLGAQVDRLSGTVKNLNTQLEQSRGDLNKANGQITSITREVNDKTAEINSLKSKLAQAEDKLSLDAKNRAEENKKHILDKEGLSLEVANAHNEVSLLKQQLEDYRRREGEHNKTINDLRRDLSSQYERISNMQQAVEEMTAQVDSAPVSVAQANAKTIARYQAQIQRITGENPNCVPVRCVRAENCKIYPLLETKKFAALKDMTLPRFAEHIRAKLSLSADIPLFVYVELEHGRQLPASQVLGDLYQSCKNEDGFLHLKYSHINA